jgi:hypothetical protein
MIHKAQAAINSAPAAVLGGDNIFTLATPGFKTLLALAYHCILIKVHP